VILLQDGFLKNKQRFEAPNGSLWHGNSYANFMGVDGVHVELNHSHTGVRTSIKVRIADYVIEHKC
jgi:hypothetical protein